MKNIPLKQYWELLARHIRPQRGRFFLLAALLLGSIALQVINPQIMRFFIDTALAGGELPLLTQAAVAFIGIALLHQVVSVSVTYLSENVAWTATNALRAELAWHCLRLDMSFHNSHTPGELIERIDGDVSEMANFFSKFVITLLGNLLLMIGILVALFQADWRAGLAFSLFAGVALFALNRVRDLALPHQKGRRQAEAEMFGYIEEQLAATEDIRANGATAFSLRELYRLQGNIMHHDGKGSRKNWIISNTTGVLLGLGLMLAVGLGYGLYAAGAATIGMVYLFIHYVNLLEAPLWALTHQMESFQVIGACVERLSELRKVQPQVIDLGSQGKPLPGGALNLRFEAVTFTYNGDDSVLRDLNFHLAPGKVLGLLGRTGSGKTTLTRLVSRLYDPSAGRIYVDGAEIREAGLETLRGRIGIVTQEVQLFRASVRDNLTFFDTTIPDERIRQVLEALELGDWFRSLPEGLDTLLQAGGHSLSAGEAQLLAFARVFLREPGLVILDEASSRLDPATEQRIERAIDRLLEGRTAIIVAHRLGTVQRADQIMILEGGQICESGERKALAQDPTSQFASLLRTGLEEVLV